MTDCKHTTVQRDGDSWYCMLCRKEFVAGDGSIDKKYYDLLYQVQTNNPDESRHDTAKRYIRQAEAHTNHPAKESTDA